MAEINLHEFTVDQLHAVKRDLEQRLARFQKAFFEKHGRNPNDQEREPAKPAIRRYRAVCVELANREAAERASRESRESEGAAGIPLRPVGSRCVPLGTVGSPAGPPIGPR